MAAPAGVAAADAGAANGKSWKVIIIFVQGKKKQTFPR